MRYTYSRWTGVQGLRGTDADDLMEALSEDLLADSDLETALQGVVRRGVEQDGEEVLPGLQTVLQQLRAQRQEDLERYNLDSMLQAIAAQVADVVETERQGIERRLAETASQPAGAPLRQAMHSVTERKESLLSQLSE